MLFGKSLQPTEGGRRLELTVLPGPLALRGADPPVVTTVRLGWDLRQISR